MYSKRSGLINRYLGDHKDVILFTAVHVKVKNDIMVCRLTTLSVKSVDCNKRGESVNR